MTRQDLQRAGSLLHIGSRWQTEVARLLRVTPRMVRWWTSGSRPIPPWVFEDLAVALERGSKASRLEAARIQLALGLPTYVVSWTFDDGRVWSRGGYSHSRAVEIKELPLRYGLPVVSASMEPEESQR